MTSIYTPSLRLEQPAQGDYLNNWAAPINQVFTDLDFAIAGYAPITTTGGTLALSANNGTPDQSRASTLAISGVLASNSTIQVPNVPKKYVVINSTSGAYTVTIGTSGGSATAAIPQGYAALITCDGNGNVTFAGPPVSATGEIAPISFPSATNTAAGIIQVATDAIAAAGTDQLMSINAKQLQVTASPIATAAAAAQATASAAFLQTDFRNLLPNPAFAVNQRAVSGTVTLAANAYGHDGAKGGAGGCIYTFATSGRYTTITISAGSLILPIDTTSIQGGVYTVSNAGTAQARVWQGTGSTGSGSYATAPFQTASLTPNLQTNVEFYIGTILRPQFELAGSASAFETRPVKIDQDLCDWFLQVFSYPANGVIASAYTSAASQLFFLPLALRPMRATPTLTIVGTFTFVNAGLGAAVANSKTAYQVFASVASGLATAAANASGSTIIISAELA